MAGSTSIQAKLALCRSRRPGAEAGDPLTVWGQALTVNALLYGFAAGAGYIYQNWLANGWVR